MANTSWVSTLTDLCWLLESRSKKAFQWERVKWDWLTMSAVGMGGGGSMKNRCLPSLGIFLNFSVFQLYHLQSKVNETCVRESSRLFRMVSWCLQRPPKCVFLAANIATYCMHTLPSWSHENPFICVGWDWGRQFNSHWKLLLRRVELEAFDRKDESLIGS